MLERDLRRLLGHPCWGLGYGLQSNLYMNFGAPHLNILEPRASRAKSSRVRELFARRHVTVRGDWRLWVHCAYWRLDLPRQRPATGASSGVAINPPFAHSADRRSPKSTLTRRLLERSSHLTSVPSWMYADLAQPTMVISGHSTNPATSPCRFVEMDDSEEGGPANGRTASGIGEFEPLRVPMWRPFMSDDSGLPGGDRQMAVQTGRNGNAGNLATMRTRRLKGSHRGALHHDGVGPAKTWPGPLALRTPLA